MNVKILRPSVLLLTLLLLAITGAAAFADPLVKGPYLMLAAKSFAVPKVVDNTAMTIRWEAEKNALVGVSCNLDWGGTHAYGNTAVVAQEKTNWYSYTMQGLTPGTLTYYRLTCQDNSYEGAFRTPPADTASALTFFAYGDTRGDEGQAKSSGQHFVLDAMKANIEQDAAKPYTLCLHTGDFIQRGQIKSEWDQDPSGLHNEFFIRKEPNQWFLSRLPVGGVLGNHEGYIRGATDYGDFAQNFKNYWPYPFYPDDRNAFYYGFDYGPVRFTVIDANDRVGNNSESGLNVTVAGLKPATAQYDWLVSELGSAKPWKIVAIHNPLYAATGPRDRFKQTPGLVTNLHNLFKATGVKLPPGPQSLLLPQGRGRHHLPDPGRRRRTPQRPSARRQKNLAFRPFRYFRE